MIEILLSALLEQHYNQKVQGTPQLLNERDGQRVFRVGLEGGMAWTVRLCAASRPYERIKADTDILTLLTELEFPAPHLHPTVTGEPAFEWQSGSWAYVADFIEGYHPTMDLATLAETGTLLGGLSTLGDELTDFPVKVGWLEEVPIAIRRALDAQHDPVWQTQAREIADTLIALPALELRMLLQGLLHTDIHEGNLLRDPVGRLYVLDWEDAGLGEAIFDLALLVGWNCVWRSPTALFSPAGRPDRYDFDETACRAVLTAYQAERSLTSAERRLLGPAIQYVMGWFAARDIERERARPGVSDGLAFTNWAIMRSVTPEWAAALANWAAETAS